MVGFRQFVEQSKEQEANVKDTLAKLPPSHRKLVKGYKIKWVADHVLSKKDDEHIGLMNPNNKTITVCSPWNYPREYTFLHEISHLVFGHFMTKKLLSEWKKILKNTKNKQNQNAEELWCMAYANHFSKNKIVIHTHKEWDDFIKKFIKLTS